MEPNETIEHYRPGTVLFREGEEGDRAYIVESGTVEISTLVEDEKVVLSHLGPGEILGEMAILDDAPRSATAIIVEDTKLRVVHRDQLRERLKEADPISRLLVRLVAARYRSSVCILRNRSGARPVRDLGDTVETYGGAMEKFKMEGELRNAVENRHLKVVYQPIVDLRSRCVVGFEALARWKHARDGYVPPQLFVALAEETNLIRGIDEFVLRKALEGIQIINTRIGDGDLFISVNVSGRQLEDSCYLDIAADCTRRAGLRPDLVKLEITEGYIAEKESSESWIKAAKEYGFSLAIDDFGTGYSSLSQLSRLEVDTVKIDRSFINRLGEVEDSERVLQGIMALAGSMNLSVIVEGIETEHQNHLLVQMGCGLGQGFFWGNPKPIEEILANNAFSGGRDSLARGWQSAFGKLVADYA